MTSLYRQVQNRPASRAQTADDEARQHQSWREILSWLICVLRSYWWTSYYTAVPAGLRVAARPYRSRNGANTFSWEVEHVSSSSSIIHFANWCRTEYVALVGSFALVILEAVIRILTLMLRMQPFSIAWKLLITASINDYPVVLQSISQSVQSIYIPGREEGRDKKEK